MPLESCLVVETCLTAEASQSGAALPRGSRCHPEGKGNPWGCIGRGPGRLPAFWGEGQPAANPLKSWYPSLFPKIAIPLEDHSSTSVKGMSRIPDRIPPMRPQPPCARLPQMSIYDRFMYSIASNIPTMGMLCGYSQSNLPPLPVPAGVRPSRSMTERGHRLLSSIYHLLSGVHHSLSGIYRLPTGVCHLSPCMFHIPALRWANPRRSERYFGSPGPFQNGGSTPSSYFC